MPAGNGKTMPREMGTVRVRVDPPEYIGDLSGVQSAELKGRSDIAGRLMTKAQALKAEASDLELAAALTREARGRMLREILTERGLSTDNDYNVDDVGRIYLTAKTPEPEALKVITGAKES